MRFGRITKGEIFRTLLPIRSRRADKEAADSGVAQIANLLFRRLGIGRVTKNSPIARICRRHAENLSATRQIVNRATG
ncbi:MAG: hypothetical protein DME23_06575 [Verrucomicrobia bacterium]|nr:MAG: hypothetical protein DME23_06575 [Verrucomicrobiota bacterium]